MTARKNGKIDVKAVRREFPMLAGRRAPVYLDSAASSQTPLPVLRAAAAYHEKFRANVHRGLYEASERATEEYEGARRKVAAFLNADPKEIVFTRGATEGLNLLAYTLAPDLGPGDEVLLTVMEHHSAFVPWQQMARRYGFAVRTVGLTGDSRLDMAALRKALKSGRVRVVSVIHVSNALGTVVPVREVADLARRAGALSIVDAAQSAGHRDLDVREIGCDFLAFSGHKMFGPTGIGALYGRAERLGALPPFLFGGDMVARVTLEESSWNEIPWKFEAGTPNIAGAIGLGAAVDFVNRLGIRAIRLHEEEITAKAIRRLSRLKGVTVFGPPPGEGRGGLVSFALEGVHPHDLSGILGQRGVCVRGGHHCAMPLMLYLGLPGTTRASFSVYTNDDDIDALIAAVMDAKRIFSV